MFERTVRALRETLAFLHRHIAINNTVAIIRNNILIVLVLILFVIGVSWLAFWQLPKVLAGISLYLAYFTISIAAVALASGLIWRQPYLWLWVDPVYYSLSIVGIVLLFVSNERDRSLASLRLERENITNDIQRQERNPVPPVGQINVSIFTVAYDGIRTEDNLAIACRAAHATDGNCLEAERYQEPIEEAFNNFVLPDPKAPQNDVAVILLNFCSRNRALLDELSHADSAFETLQTFLKEKTDSDSGYMAIFNADADWAELSGKLILDRDAVVSSVAETDRKLTRDSWDNKIYLAGRLHWALSVCLSVPKDEQHRIVELQSWQQTNRTLHERKLAIDDRISKIGVDAATNPALGNNWYDFLWRHFWPFVLVAALALKLAKAATSFRLTTGAPEVPE